MTRSTRVGPFGIITGRFGELAQGGPKKKKIRSQRMRQSRSAVTPQPGKGILEQASEPDHQLRPFAEVGLLFRMQVQIDRE